MFKTKYHPGLKYAFVGGSTVDSLPEKTCLGLGVGFKGTSAPLGPGIFEIKALMGEK
jgi:hypothetical protein